MLSALIHRLAIVARPFVPGDFCPSGIEGRPVGSPWAAYQTQPGLYGGRTHLLRLGETTLIWDTPEVCRGFAHEHERRRMQVLAE